MSHNIKQWLGPHFVTSLKTKSTEYQHKCYSHKISHKMAEDITDTAHHKKYPFTNANAVIAKNWKWIVIKPVLIFYCFQYAIIQAVTSQLWLEKTCLVTFGYNETVCKDLTDTRWNDIENDVQKKVATYNIVTNYISGIPPIIISLYLGPLADNHGKIILALPFLGHLLAGAIPFLVVYLPQCPPQVLWVYNIYLLFGGYSVLQIAMFSHISDATNSKNRTTSISILQGLSLIIFPIAEFAGGQIFQVGGYGTVYIVSIFSCVCGLLYVIIVVPTRSKSHSTSRREVLSSTDDKSGLYISGREKTEFHQHRNMNKRFSLIKTLETILRKGNQTIIDSYRCLVRTRENGKRKLILSLLGVSMFSGMQKGVHKNGLLFTEKAFAWSVVDYTNYRSFECTIYALRTFITTPILCHVLLMHDCMLAIVGGLSTVAADVTIGLSNQGWMMYYGTALSVMGGMLSTPLRSMLSKCVESHEYGKIFTLSSVASALASLMSSVIIQEMYKYTLDTFPGAIYLFHGGIELVAVFMMAIIYTIIKRQDR